MGDFDGIRVLITGGASGIGAAAAQLMLARGAAVACLDREPAGTPEGCEAIRADVAKPAVSEAVEEAARLLRGLDVVVNNAGIGAVGTVEDSDDATFRSLFEVNVLGAVRVSRAALPYLRESPNPAIVNVGSVAARIGLPLRAAYSASKGAVLSLTLAMAADYLAEGIRVSCVAPGTADTPWVRRLIEASENPSQEFRALALRQPTGRLVSAAEVAQTISYLASPQSGSTTAVVATVDGGLTGLRLPR